VLRALAPYLAFAYLSFVRWTTRVVYRNQEARDALRRDGKRSILAFWHNRQVFFTTTHGNDNYAVLVSLSRDGEIIAKVMELSGIGAARGSSSRNAAGALRAMLEFGKAGIDVAISPDGPKGPVYAIKPGILFLAQKLGSPIVPVTNALSRKLVLERSWDKFQVPLPFGRAVIRYGKPVHVGPDDDLEAKAAELKASLDRATAEAEAELAA
jgi:lysophospholipid acyltransferase (LPLAT)-like uncharacterized protein